MRSAEDQREHILKPGVAMLQYLAMVFIKKAGLISLFCVCWVSLSWAQPQFDFSQSQKVLHQGEILRLDMWSKKPVKRATVSFNKKKQPVFDMPMKKNPKPYHYMTYIGIPRTLSPGRYACRYAITLENQARFVKTLYITVKKGDFAFTKLSFSPKKSKLIKKTKQLSSEAALLSRHFKKVSLTPYFSKTCLLPAEGRYSSLFGTYRLYNNQRHSRKHAGLDIANVIGTPVIAPQAGKVILSQSLESHGKTVMVDHGLGIISIYNHLSKREVNVGHVVKQGQKIGEIGKTGIATGPHLHWGLSINNTRVDPLFWIKEAERLR